MKRRLLLCLAFIGTLATVSITGSQNVSALSGSCYFGSGTCTAAPSCPENDVLPGRDSNCGGRALGNVADASVANTKSTFINTIINKRGDGNPRVSQGARFIMAETTGFANDTAKFRELLEQPDVTITVETRDVSRSSFRDAGKNDFFYTSYSAPNKRVIVIKYKGQVKSIIEVQCANMTGNPTPPPPPPKTTIRPHAELPDPGPYVDNQRVNVDAWVGKDGPDTKSNWTFTLWYENNGNDTYNSGPDDLITSDSGGPTNYGTPRTDIKDQKRPIDGNKKRICVSLNLSNARTNVEGGDTNIAGNPDKQCRGISSTTVLEHDPVGSISVVCNNPATSRQRITYSFNDQDGVATGSISSNSGYSASGLAETSGVTVYHRPDTGGKTYTLTVTNPKAAGGFGASKAFSATSPPCSPGAVNELTPDVELSTSTLEPGQQVSATAEVECNPGTSPSSSSYRRIFWYENGGNPSRYDHPSDVFVSVAYDESGTKTYCTVPNPFSTWGPTTVPATGVTRVCTSLQLSGPSANATISGSGIAVDCANVATKFFFQTTLGDVNALGCLSSCASTPTISGFSGGPSSYRGSGSQIGALSAGTIREFTSSNNPSNYTVASNNSKRLTFANTGAGYGGNFSQRYLIPEYWGGATTSANQTVGTSPANVITNGDVYITGNSPVGSVGVGNVPGLRWVIARNIYIAGSLAALDGVYIAKENIYTCGTSSYSAVPLSQMAAQCATPLVIRGSLIAGGSVKLQRTTGSLSTTPAETIEYNPFVWMQGINPANPLPTSTSGKLDFITTLPPIL